MLRAPLRGLLVQLSRGAEAAKLLATVPKSANRDEEGERLLLIGLAWSDARHLDAAEKAFNDAKRAGADADLVDSGIATLRVQAGKLDEAEALLRAVLRRSPQLSGALYNLAVVRVRRGDLAEAAGLIRQSWAMGLQDAHQLKHDPDLKELREEKGLIDDLMIEPIPRCRTW